MGPFHEGSIRRPIAPWANALLLLLVVIVVIVGVILTRRIQINTYTNTIKQTNEQTNQQQQLVVIVVIVGVILTRRIQINTYTNTIKQTNEQTNQRKTNNYEHFIKSPFFAKERKCIFRRHIIVIIIGPYVSPFGIFACLDWKELSPIHNRSYHYYYYYLFYFLEVGGACPQTPRPPHRPL